MFKKSLAAIAVLGTAAGFACAADVTLYGIVDQGLIFNKTKVEAAGETTKTNNFGLESGVSSASRFGLKGTEDLGNGLKVGFKLENGFNADDGSFGDDDRLFNREASLTLSGDFGALSFGRMGGVGSSAGVDSVYLTADAFDGGDNDVLGLAKSSRYDNMVQYQTPVFAGVQGTFQYSFKNDSTQKQLNEVAREGSAAADRYMGAAVNGTFGPVQAVLGYEFFNYASNDGKKQNGVEDGQIVYLGGNYDCGFAKTFVMAQYFKDLNKKQLAALDFDAFTGLTNTFEGYGLHLGTQFAALGGDFTFGGYFVDGNTVAAAAADERDLAYYGFGAKYEYALSKRTSLYTGAGYGKTKLDAAKAEKHDTVNEVTQAYVGLTHRF